MVTKISVGNYVGISTTTQNFIQIGLGDSFLRMRDFAPLVTRLLFWVLEKGYSRDACTDFEAKYVKRRGSAQGSAFWGSRNQNLRFRAPFSPKPPFWGEISTGLRIFSPENGFNIGRLESKVKGKVFPYSLPSVGPGADPGVQAAGDVK